MTARDYLVRDFGKDIACAYAPGFVAVCWLYLPALWLLHKWMQHRPPYTLKWTSVAWNLILSTLSGIGALVFLVWDPKCLFVKILPNQNYHPYIRLVIVVFCLTKPLEFGDTVLLILRKKPIRFLHVYHHVTIALYGWHAQRVSANFGHNMTFINLSIHWWMYLYYALTFVIPRHPFLRRTRSYITTAQILQMFVGMWMSCTSLQNSQTQGELRVNAICSLMMYISYAYLFIVFYLETYTRGLQSTMVISLGTMYMGALLGAVSVWKHHSLRWWLGMELVMEWALTVALGRQFWRLTYRAIANQTAPLGEKDREPQPASQTSTEASDDATRSAAQQLHRRSSRQTPSFPSNGQKDNGGVAFSNAEVIGTVRTTTAQRFCSNEHHQRQFAELRRHHLSRICLMLCNPWMAWALEHRISRKLAGKVHATPSSVKADAPSSTHSPQCCSKTSTALLPILTKDLVFQSGIPLEAQHKETEVLGSLGFSFSRLTEDRILLVAACWTSAAVGYVLHGNWLLGVLVHGCLRWVIELHTAGILGLQTVCAS